MYGSPPDPSRSRTRTSAADADHGRGNGRRRGLRTRSPSRITDAVHRRCPPSRPLFPNPVRGGRSWIPEVFSVTVDRVRALQIEDDRR